MEELLLENDFGFCLGYFVQDIEQFDYNYGISDYTVIKNVFDVLKSQNIKKFIFVEELFIEPEFRNNGYGKELFINFLEQFDDENSPVLLFAGSVETPPEMDIVSFYEFFGFEVLLDSSSSPLMIKNHF